MQRRLARSITALRYELSSRRALDNAARMAAEHDRLLAEIDALARRLDDAAPAATSRPAAAAEPPAAGGEHSPPTWHVA